MSEFDKLRAPCSHAAIHCLTQYAQIDRCIAPLSAYATLKEKRQKARHPKPATLIIEEIYQRQKMSPQLVGASATIGRPLRRELARYV